MGLVVGGVAGFAGRPETVLFVGVDNLNSLRGVVKEKTRCMFSLNLMCTFLFRRAGNNVDVAVCYLRTSHIATEGEIARLPEDRSPNGRG